MKSNKAPYKREANHLLFWLIGSLSWGVVGFSQVGIGTSAPNSKAALDISSTNKGLLIPRITKANRPVTPPAGMMIYQTDNTPGFYFYNGTKWQRFYTDDDPPAPINNPLPGASNDPAATPGATGSVVGADGITYVTVRLGDGSIWLQQNLGANRVATSINDVLSYGDLYQWGRWTDRHEKRTPVFSRTISTSEPNPNNPAGLIKQWGINVNPYYYQINTTWWSAVTNINPNIDLWAASTPQTVTASNGCDPCKLLLGGTWRLPTRPEYQGLINNASVTGTIITNLNNGFTSHLKINAPGLRGHTSTTLFDLGTRGLFWTSTADAVFSTSSATAFYFEINNSSVNFGNTVSTTQRGFGLSIRCKKD
jgi:uncharacterized protein (TIGR02145 family)